MSNKNLYSKCNKIHLPPTGRKCKYSKKGQVNTDNDIHVIPYGGVPANSTLMESDSNVLPDGGVPVLKSKKNMAIHDNLSDSSSAEEEQSMQLQILQEVKRMNSSVDAVEDRMASGEIIQHQRGSTNRLSRKVHKNCVTKSLLKC